MSRMSKILLCEIIHNNKIAQDIYKMCLKLPGNYPRPEPGQFVNLYLNDESRLLPRPLSVCDWEKGALTLVYAVVGAGTKIISEYRPGKTIRCSTPLGQGFKIEGSGQDFKMVGTEQGFKIEGSEQESKMVGAEQGIEMEGNCILVGGGAGTPPLLYLAKRLMENGETKVRVILGFKSEPFLAEEFPYATEIATDDGSSGFKGKVTDLLAQSSLPANSRIFSCGPRPMLKSLASFADAGGIALQVSLEERMGCGYGACVGCTCKTTKGQRKVCEDGPVFYGSEVLWDE